MWCILERKRFVNRPSLAEADLLTNMFSSATDVEGIFRLAGAERRIKELQSVFNSPDRYGKGLDWKGYTVHDAANVLRRYFNQLPEPIIPLDFYQRFRDPLRNHQAQAVGEIEGQEPASGDFDAEIAIKTYQRLITELPPLNRQLLLYILDLLAVFASKAELNRMTAPNLSAIFQPGLLSHPTHDLSPKEYRLSQDVLIFLIENQDHFLVGMQGTAADEKTIQDVQNASAVAAAPKASPQRSSPTVARSASNASAGAESVRKYGGIRRNASMNSRRSRQSGNTQSPATPPDTAFPSSSKAGGVHRSNTVPSKKSGSPALGTSSRFHRDKSVERHGRSTAAAGSNQHGASLSEAITGQRNPSANAANAAGQAERMSPHLRPVTDKKSTSADRQLRTDLPPAGMHRNASPANTPSRDRAFQSIFRQSPTSEADRNPGRKPNKLQKKRPDRPEHAGLSVDGGNSSSHPSSPGFPSATLSLSHRSSRSQADGKRPEMSPPPSHQIPGAFEDPIEDLPPPVLSKESQRTDEDPAEALAPREPSQQREGRAALKDNENRASAATLKPNKSPAGSSGSHATNGHGYSSHDNADDGDTGDEREKRRHRWRISHSAKKDSKEAQSLQIGSAAGAERSASTVASNGRPRKSSPDESTATQSSSALGQGGPGAEHENNGEKKGPLGWFKGKLHEREEKKAEKERAKSPPPTGKGGFDHHPSTQSLGAMTGEAQRTNSSRPLDQAEEQSLEKAKS